MLRLWVKNNTDGSVHEYGTDKHDALILQEDGSLHYENLQNSTGTMFPEEGYSFCSENGEIPDPTNVDDDAIIDIGGCFYNNTEVRKRDIQIGKPGGNSSKNAKNYRIGIPSIWAQALGITPEDKTVTIAFDGERIVIEKALPEE